MQSPSTKAILPRGPAARPVSWATVPDTAQARIAAATSSEVPGAPAMLLAAPGGRMATGIGLVGAGAVLRHPEAGTVEGLTAAAAAWVAATIGIACGLSQWPIVRWAGG